MSTFHQQLSGFLSPLFYFAPFLSTETISGLGSKSRDFCENFDPDLYINLMNPNVISLLLLLGFEFFLCSSLTFYCNLHKQLYRCAGFVLEVQHFTLSCFRKQTDHLCWKSPLAASASPASLIAHLHPEAKGPANSSVWSETVKVLSII